MKAVAVTPFEDVNNVLRMLSTGVADILAGDLVGVYLFGSLTYGDFHPESSDIDVMVIVREAVSALVLERIQRLHEQVAAAYPTWAKRLECSYTPLMMLHETLPPKAPRPYLGEGILYKEAEYGNEWIINLYLLQKHGQALVGPAFMTLREPVSIEAVRKACIRDLFREWEPKMNDPAWLANSHYQSYVVLNLCRILYTVRCSAAGSKTVAAAWVKSTFPQWCDLIETAEGWHYGVEMARQAEAIVFIRFVIDTIKALPLYPLAMGEVEG